MTPAISTLGLTPQQARALAFIAECMDKGFSPTVEEVRVALGAKSRSGVHGVLVGLRERGKIHWRERMQRSIVLVADRRAGHVLPPDLQARVERWCAGHGDDPLAFVVAAVTVHLDEMEAVPEAELRETEAAYGGAP